MELEGQCCHAERFGLAPAIICDHWAADSPWHNLCFQMMVTCGMRPASQSYSRACGAILLIFCGGFYDQGWSLFDIDDQEAQMIRKAAVEEHDSARSGVMFDCLGLRNSVPSMRIHGTITLLFHGELSTFYGIACHLRLLPSLRSEMVRCVSRLEASQDDTRRRLATPFKAVSAKAQYWSTAKNVRGMIFYLL